MELLYTDAAVKKLEASGMPILREGRARPTPAADPQWIFPFTRLKPTQFRRLVRLVAQHGGGRIADGQPDRVLLVAAYWRTNLTRRQIGPLFGVSYSAAYRVADTIVYQASGIKDHLAGRPLIADGGYQGHPEMIMPYRKPLDGQPQPEWKEELHRVHREV